MPQEVRVLQCFDCKTYQVDLVKKAKKWSCKLCGIKQTLREELYRGTGAECRSKVQHLNMAKGQRAYQHSEELLNVFAGDEIVANTEEKETVPQNTVENRWSMHMNPEYPNPNRLAIEERKRHSPPHVTEAPVKKISKWDTYL